VSIGHNAIVHGCVIDDNVLVGMGAIVMDNTKIGCNCIIAAGAVVLENSIVEAGSLYAGVPAKKIKTIPQALIDGEISRIANNYVMYADWFRDEIRI
jgi:carbonic anhydrase/acetyltransferase-like protein (isoleucine patch superfamily)